MTRKQTRKEDPLDGLIAGVIVLVVVLAYAKGAWWIVGLLGAAGVVLAVSRSRRKASNATEQDGTIANATVAADFAVAAMSPSISAQPTTAAETESAEWSRDLSLYSLRRTFFNRTENAFYRALLRAVQDRYWIFPKVRLLDICDDVPGNVYSARNRIWARHVDFLLCSPISLKPVAAIEVDGSSHQRRDRVDSDAFKDALFVKLGLPLIRVPASSWFEPADVLRRIDAMLPGDQPRSPN